MAQESNLPSDGLRHLTGSLTTHTLVWQSLREGAPEGGALPGNVNVNFKSDFFKLD